VAAFRQLKNVSLVVSLLIIGISAAEAQIESGRPLRTIPPQATSAAAHSSLITANSALISNSALVTQQSLDHALTKHYIAQYTSPHGIASLNAALERGSIYLPFIREEIARRNLPPEIAFLPVIESGFVITARSRSGAAGLWQFMTNSIAPFNMRVTDLIDERRDFVKSTLGALQKLQDNYGVLGNWELALAAYNSGLGDITRTIRRTGRGNYWELCARGELRQETIHYVPKLIAAVYIISQPRRYGLNVWHDNIEWTTVSLPRQISIDMLSDELNIGRDLLRRLNAELLHGISPMDSGYRLKIPAEYLERVTQTLQRNDLPLIRHYYHTVHQGDTLWSMSRYYNMSVDMIEQHNPGISNRYLQIGERVLIPASANTPAPPPAAAHTPAASAVNFNGNHVVQRGETLWSLSRRYGVDPEALAGANGMEINQILREGRTLRVPIID